MLAIQEIEGQVLNPGLKKSSFFQRMYNVINTYLDILQDEYSPWGFMYIFILNIEPTSSATCLLQLIYLNHNVKSQNIRI